MAQFRDVISSSQSPPSPFPYFTPMPLPSTVFTSAPIPVLGNGEMPMSYIPQSNMPLRPSISTRATGHQTPPANGVPNGSAALLCTGGAMPTPQFHNPVPLFPEDEAGGNIGSRSDGFYDLMLGSGIVGREASRCSFARGLEGKS